MYLYLSKMTVTTSITETVSIKVRSSHIVTPKADGSYMHLSQTLRVQRMLRDAQYGISLGFEPYSVRAMG